MDRVVQNSSIEYISHKGITFFPLLTYFPIFKKKTKQNNMPNLTHPNINLALALRGVKQKKLFIISSNNFDMISFVLFS